VCSVFCVCVCFVLFFVKMRRQVRVQFFVCVLFPVFCKDEKAGACAVFCVCALYCFL
jgi:hypothetical protein